MTINIAVLLIFQCLLLVLSQIILFMYDPAYFLRNWVGFFFEGKECVVAKHKAEA